MERMVKIPPPVLKENETEYLEELSKIKKAAGLRNILVKVYLTKQETMNKISDKYTPTSSSISDSLAQFNLLALPFALLLLLGLLLESLYSSGGGGCYGVCGLSGWGGP